MATISMHKDFVVKDKKAFEQLKKDVESKADYNRTVKSAPSLEKAAVKLKQFTFR